MPTAYQLAFTAAEIDAALAAASPSATDFAPNLGDTNLVNSNRIALALNSEAAARIAADGALHTRVSALEGATLNYLQDTGGVSYSTSIVTPGTSQYVPQKSKTFTGLVITGTNGPTCPVGTYVVTLMIALTNVDSSFTLDLYVGGVKSGNSLVSITSNNAGTQHFVARQVTTITSTSKEIALYYNESGTTSVGEITGTLLINRVA